MPAPDPTLSTAATPAPAPPLIDQPDAAEAIAGYFLAKYRTAHPGADRQRLESIEGRVRQAAAELARGRLAAREEASEEHNEERRTVFLALLAASVDVMSAAELADVPIGTVYSWRTADPDFERRWDDALEASLSAVDRELFEMALTGRGNLVQVRAAEALHKTRSRSVRPDRVRSIAPSVTLRRVGDDGSAQELTVHYGAPIPD